MCRPSFRKPLPTMPEDCWQSLRDGLGEVTVLEQRISF